MLAFAQHVEALPVPLMLFVPETGTATAAVAANSVMDKLHTAQCKRSVPFFCSSISDCAALLGTAMGLELSHKDSAFALCYKTVNGIQPSDLTQTQVDSIKALNGNVYVARGYTHFLLENGSVSNGQRYDEVLPFIERKKLDPWTHNKAIGKSIESYRITDEQKNYLRSLKIKRNAGNGE